MAEAQPNPHPRRPSVVMVVSPTQGCVKVPCVYGPIVGKTMFILRGQFRDLGFYPGTQRQLSESLSERLAKARA